jgi:hypothetical protein
MNITAHTVSANPAWVQDAQVIARSVAEHPLASPLRAAVAFFAPPRTSPAKPQALIAPKRITPFGAAACNDPQIRDHASPALRTAAPAVRVVRVIDPKLPQGAAGRMRISGRIDHVCAELDRLAALEAVGQANRRAA